MELRDYVRALRRSWPLLLVCVILGGLIAAAVTWREKKIYAAVETMVVSSSDGSDTAASAYQGGLLSQQRVKSYADLLASERVAAEVIGKLGLNDSPGSLRGHIAAQAVPDTVLLRAVVTDPDRRRAQMIADAVGEAFSDAVAQIETPAPGKVPSVRVNVWEKAKLPDAPVSPNPARSIGLGALLGLIVSTAAAVARHRLDTSVGTDTDVTAATGLSTLGTIAFDPSGASRPLAGILGAQSARAEAFRQLRTNLQFVDVDEPPRTVVVTSSTSAEGKTTTTCNLAIALAQTGVRVALVEADLRRPSFGNYLGIETAAGLTSVLIGTADLDDVLLPWGDETGRLHVLPSGPLPPNPSELLGSRGMGELLGKLSDRFDLVLIDAPPLLPVTDAAVLATQTDGALLVVRSGRTRREQLTRATEALRTVDARILGVVLNMVPVKGRDAASYYGFPTAGMHFGVGVEPGGSRRRTAAIDQRVPAAPGSGSRPAKARHLARAHTARSYPAGSHPGGDLERVAIASQRRPHGHELHDADTSESITADFALDVDHARVAGRTTDRDTGRDAPLDHGSVADDLATDRTTPLTFDAKTVASRRHKRS